MSLSSQTLPPRQDWIVVDPRPVYSISPQSYYLQPDHLELEGSRHLRVVEYVTAPPEDPNLDW